MHSWKHCPCPRLLGGAVALVLTFAASIPSLKAQGAFPTYDHVFLVVMENEGYNQMVGNEYAPILNALANDYGVATDYRGVADPSEPNYVAMIGGSDFGITTDDPYWFPGQTVDAANLMSQLEGQARRGGAISRACPIPGIAAIAIRTSAMAFPMPIPSTSRSTMAS